MKVGYVAAGILLVTSAWFMSAFGANQFVQIRKPFANIYEFLDPKSKILIQAKRGDSYELVYAGTSWYQVKYRNQVGWLERRSGDVVGSSSRVPVLTILGFVVLLGATLGVTFYVVQRQRVAQA